MFNLTIVYITKEQFMLGCDEIAMNNVLLIIKKNCLLHLRFNTKQHNKNTVCEGVEDQVVI